jgi:hypothetical protein
VAEDDEVFRVRIALMEGMVNALAVEVFNFAKHGAKVFSPALAQPQMQKRRLPETTPSLLSAP